MAPDMSAETGEGASGWARGSQTCSGTAPAFDPKPARARTNARDRTAGGIPPAWAAIAAKDWPPACAPIRTNASRIAAAPAWVITAYHWAASRASRRRCPVSSSSSDDSAISSQAAMNVAMLAAAGTSSRLVMNSGSSAGRGPAPAAAGRVAGGVAAGRRAGDGGRR